MSSDTQSGSSQFGGRAALSDAAPFSARLLLLVNELQRDYIRDGLASPAWWSHALEKLLALTESEYGFIGTIGEDEQGRFLRTRAITDISWDDETHKFFELHRSTGLVFRNPNTLFGRVLVERCTVVSNDVEHDLRAGGRPPGHPPLRTFLGLACGDDPSAMVGLANRAGGFDESLVESLAPVATFVGSIVEQERVNARQRVAAAQLSAVLAATQDCIVMIDERGTILDAGAGIVKLLGFDPADCIGRNVSTLMPSPDREAHDGHLDRYRRTGEKRIIGTPRVVRARKSDGSLLWVELFVTDTTMDGERRFVGVMRDVTSRVENEQRLERVAVQLSAALEMAKAAHWEYDVASDRFTFNDAFYKIFGASAEAMGGYVLSSAQYASRFVHPEEAGVVREEIGRALDSASVPYSGELEHRFLYFDGRVGYLAVRLSLERSEDGRVVKLYGVNQDVTERRRQEMAHARIDEQEKTNQELAERIQELDRTQVMSALTSECVGLVQRCLSLPEGMEVVSRFVHQMYPSANVDVFLQHDGEDELVRHATFRRFGDAGAAETLGAVECWALRMRRAYASSPDGARLACAHTRGYEYDLTLCGPLMSLERMVALVSVAFPRSSVTNMERERRTARLGAQFETTIQSISGALSTISLRESLQRLALVDELTGLPNRRAFAASAARAVARARRSRTSLAFAIFDLDHFKRVNDTFGHDEGDRVLQQVARVASTFFRDDDIAGRHGGEEFVVLLNGITEPVAMARFDAFREEISRACRAGGQQVTVSIGFTTVDPDEATALDALLRDADRALYEAKRRGRNQVHSFRAVPVDTESAS